MALLDTTKRKKLYFDIVLDKQQYYFHNDKIRGKVVLITPKSLYVKRVQLVWKGVVKVQIGSLKHEQHVLFQHTEYLYIDDQNSSFYLKPGDYYEFFFNLEVPVSVPSFTESEFYVGGSVEYSIEAFLDRPTTSLFPRARTHRLIPLLDRISITKPEFNTKKSISTKQDDRMMELILPKTAFKRNQIIEATITLINSKHDVQVTLIRMTQVICKERLYLLPQVIVESTKIPILDILSSSSGSNTCQLVIPQTTSPSIHEHAHLLHVSYLVRATCHDLLIECPITIGTYPIYDDDIKPDVVLQPIYLRADYEVVPNTKAFLDRQISSAHQFHETATKIHHSSIHTGSSFKQKKGLYDDDNDDNDDEGFTSLYSMSNNSDNNNNNKEEI